MNVWQTFDETVEVPPTAHYFVFGVNSYFGTTIYVGYFIARNNIIKESYYVIMLLSRQS